MIPHTVSVLTLTSVFTPPIKPNEPGSHSPSPSRSRVTRWKYPVGRVVSDKENASHLPASSPIDRVSSFAISSPPAPGSPTARNCSSPLTAHSNPHSHSHSHSKLRVPPFPLLPSPSPVQTHSYCTPATSEFVLYQMLILVSSRGSACKTTSTPSTSSGSAQIWQIPQDTCKHQQMEPRRKR